MAARELLTLKTTAAGAAARRTLLGMTSGLLARQRVFRIAEGLEVDEIGRLEVTRRRVFFEDVVLVTYHRTYQWPVLLVTAFAVAAFLVLGVTAQAAGAPPGAMILAWSLALALGAVLAFRVALRVDVVTVQGTRTAAAMHYLLHKGRARRVFEEICAAAADTQEALRRRARPPEAGTAGDADPPPGPPPPSPAA